MSKKPTFIKDLGMKFPTKTSKTKERYWLVECPICCKNYSVQAKSIKSNRSTKCKSCSSKISKTKHNKYGTRIYKIYYSMKSRCNNTKSKHYKNYGGRGIEICSEWLNDFNKFHKWALENGYSDNLTIDRINNDGNYEPNNCRWTTRNVQSRNTRLLSKRNTSGYRGVSKHRNSFVSEITVDNKNIYLGYYKTKELAAIAYNKYVATHKLEHPLNIIKSL